MCECVVCMHMLCECGWISDVYVHVCVRMCGVYVYIVCVQICGMCASVHVCMHMVCVYMVCMCMVCVHV